MRVVICGGGVIGAATAYFLSKQAVAVTVVERTGLACAASGKSGAFLALDWNNGSRLDALARRSYHLHAQLTEEIDADWSYQQLTTYSGYAAPGRGLRGRSDLDLPWLGDSVALGSQIGSTATTASVHPGNFVRALMGAAQANGAELRIGEVTGIRHDGPGSKAQGVEVDGSLLEADAVVVAMGPWSILAAGWLPLPGIYAYKGHSLLFQTGTTVSPDALFLEIQDRRGSVLTPEVFPRGDGTTYVAYSSVQDPLPVDPAEVAPNPEALTKLQAICSAVSPSLSEDRVIARQACYRPVTQDGLPLIGRVPGIDGAYVATGHSVWGVLNAPATGEALAELIVDGAAHSSDLRPFAPGRLRAFDPHSLR